MKKLIHILVLCAFFGCGTNITEKHLYNVPTLEIRKGLTKGFDLSVYKPNPKTNLQFEFHPDVILQFNNITDSLFITPKDSIESLILINGYYGIKPFNLLVSIRPTFSHTFSYIFNEKNTPVSIMGNFNDWSRTSHFLEDKNNNGTYKISLDLNPEKYEYKFVVGESEILDPENENLISNNMGGWNSVLDLSPLKGTPSGQWIKKTHKDTYLTFSFLKSDNALPMKTIVLWNNLALKQKEINQDKNGNLIVNIKNLENGFLKITGIDSQGRIIRENQTIIENGKPINLIDNPDKWYFKTIYSLMIDRFLDGD